MRDAGVDTGRQEKQTRIRFAMLSIIFVNVVINYMDRSNISVAGTAISGEFKLNPVQTGLIFSAFGWTYAALQVPGGILADRIAPRILYCFSLVLWSVTTVLQGLIKGFIVLFGLRLATGAFEAPAYPTNNRIVTSWFPIQERASAISVYTAGQYVGLAFLTPALVTLQYYMGWRGLFVITGLVGIVWGIAWYFLYRDPFEHPRVNNAELDHIKKGGGIIDKGTGRITGNIPFTWSDLRNVSSHRKLWGIYIGQFAVTSTLWFFLTWFPTYLVKYRHLEFIQSGFLASIPFLAAFTGILFSGFLSDYLLKKGISAGIARKTPVIMGLFLSISIIGANYTNDPAWVIFFMSLAFFGNGIASITWVFVSSLAPGHLIGLTGGVFNFIGNLSSIVIPVAIGYLVKGDNFSPALIFIGCMALLGACSYIFLVGKIEQVKI
ncbi:MAG: MFS transporter [Bacteroidota bacterium]|nr:MFS transporter [Bacteroidota bacterium]